jgi:hypothetical protein
LRCSASTNLVSVMQSESRIVFFDVIAAEVPGEARERKSGATASGTRADGD